MKISTWAILALIANLVACGGRQQARREELLAFPSVVPAAASAAPQVVTLAVEEEPSEAIQEATVIEAIRGYVKEGGNFIPALDLIKSNHLPRAKVEFFCQAVEVAGGSTLDWHRVVGFGGKYTDILLDTCADLQVAPYESKYFEVTDVTEKILGAEAAAGLRELSPENRVRFARLELTYCSPGVVDRKSSQYFLHCTRKWAVHAAMRSKKQMTEPNWEQRWWSVDFMLENVNLYVNHPAHWTEPPPSSEVLLPALRLAETELGPQAVATVKAAMRSLDRDAARWQKSGKK